MYSYPPALLLFAFPFFLAGQPAFIPSDEIPVADFQNLLDYPWAGGINAGQFNQIDLNQDGVPDVLIFDRVGNRILPMIHDGTVGFPSYTYDPGLIDSFPEISGWVHTADYNLDGKYDLFTSNQDGILVFTNVSDPQSGLTFELYPGPYPIQTIIPGSNQQVLEVMELDIPVIEDMDNDGDLDVLTFNTLGTLIEYHKNLSVETYGHSDSLVYILEEACWGHVMEDDVDFTVSMGVFCKNGTASGGGGLHAGSTMLALDLDGDGDKELALGDVGSSGMLLLTNGGDQDHADITAVSASFPASNAVNLDIFPAAYHLDLNYDGVQDLILSPNSQINAENVSVAWYYPNTGTDSIPSFSFFRDNLFVEEMIDVGTGSTPVLFDYDQDGKTDLLIGNHGYYDFGDFVPQIALYRNTGTDSLPFFDLITGDLGDVGLMFLTPDIHPALGDLDGDGDYDLLLGRSDGTLDFYRNFSQSPDNVLPQLGFETGNYAGIDVGGNATPQLVDVDGDSLIDLLIGEKNGNLNYYRNVGSPTSPGFVLESGTFGGIQMSVDGFQPGYSVPAAYESDGQLHLVVGSDIGVMKYYENIRNDLTGIFAGDTLMSGKHFGNRVAPALADLNSDGYPELIAGNSGGGLHLFMGTEPMMVGIEAGQLQQKEPFLIFPNPTQGQLTIQMDQPIRPANAFLHTLDGRLVHQFVVLPGRNQIELEGLPPGMYVCKILLADGKSYHQKVLLLP